jgi:hypothetical protein
MITRTIRQTVVAVVALLVSAGCVSQTQFLNNKQEMAIESALTRAKFEMNCQEATGTVLSREVVQPGVVAPVGAGIWRAEYTIGVSGCNQRHTYVVVCPDGGEGCFAAGPGRFTQE